MTPSITCTLPSSTDHQAVSVGRRSLSARAQSRGGLRKEVSPSTVRPAEAGLVGLLLV